MRQFNRGLGLLFLRLGRLMKGGTDSELYLWAVNGATFSAWAEAAQIVFAFTPNSAAAERVFSMLKWMFGDLQMEALADIIQTALMLRMNGRQVG